MRQKLFSALVLSVWGSVAEAATRCVAESLSGRTQMVCRARSDAGKTLRLVFDTNKITTESMDALLCSEPNAAVDEVKLWMPDMGHGSGPTTLAPGPAGCTAITDIDFLMAGVWQLKVHFPDDGDKGVIDVDVAR